jgi:hypothetical protein
MPQKLQCYNALWIGGPLPKLFAKIKEHLGALNINVVDQWCDRVRQQLPLNVNLILINADRVKHPNEYMVKGLADKAKLRCVYVGNGAESTIRKLQQSNILPARLPDEYYEEFRPTSQIAQSIASAQQPQLTKDPMPTSDTPLSSGAMFTTKAPNTLALSHPVTAKDGPSKGGLQLLLRQGKACFVRQLNGRTIQSEPMSVNGITYCSLTEAGASIKVGASAFSKAAASMIGGNMLIKGYKCRAPTFDECEKQFDAIVERHLDYTARQAALKAEDNKVVSAIRAVSEKTVVPNSSPTLAPQPAPVKAAPANKSGSTKPKLFKLIELRTGVLLEPLQDFQRFKSLDDVPQELLDFCE